MRRAVPIIILVVAIVGLLAIRFVPAFIPISQFPFGQTLYDLGLWVIDRGQAVGPEVLVKLVMQVAVTVPVLIAALFVVVSNRYKAPEKNWAFGALGAILGAWLVP
jgi:hypothetical protein